VIRRGAELLRSDRAERGRQAATRPGGGARCAGFMAGRRVRRRSNTCSAGRRLTSEEREEWLGRARLVLAGFGWLWLALAGFGWLWGAWRDGCRATAYNAR